MNGWLCLFVAGVFFAEAVRRAWNVTDDEIEMLWWRASFEELARIQFFAWGSIIFVVVAVSGAFRTGG